MFARILFIFVCAGFLAGCGPTVMLVSQPKSFDATAQFKLDRPASNFLDAASKAGTSLGYHVAGVDTRKNVITLTKSAGAAMGVLVGQVNEVGVALSLAPDGSTVNVALTVVANFDKGEQEAASKIIEELKTALVRELIDRRSN